MNSFDKLLKGNDKFLSENYKKNAERYLENQPKTMVISCSDSRMCPDVIFNTTPGSLFVVRAIASIVHSYEVGEQASTKAAIQYGIKCLKIENIVVLGHHDCGGVKYCMNCSTTLQTKEKLEQNIEENADIFKWLEKPSMHLNLKGLNTDDSSSDDIQQKNAGINLVKYSMNNLNTFPDIQNVKIYGAYFDVRNGSIEQIFID